MTELDEKIQQANIERARKYPLLMIVDNRKEIREISISAQDYMVELNPELKKVKIWEVIPRITIEFILAALKKLNKSDAMNEGESTIIIGDIMEIGIDGMFTTDGDKDGNITPLIKTRSEFKYENVSLPYRDEMTIDQLKVLQSENCEGLPVQFYDNREEIKEISKMAMKVLLSDYGVKMGGDDEWYIIPLTVVAFFRKTRDWLVEHKDDGEAGVEINFANLINIGISKEGGFSDDDPVDYVLYIQSEQIFKKDNAKDDGKTEND